MVDPIAPGFERSVQIGNVSGEVPFLLVEPDNIVESRGPLGADGLV